MNQSVSLIPRKKFTCKTNLKFLLTKQKIPSNSYLLFHSIQHQKDESANKESKKSLGSLSGDASAEEDASILEELAMISRINHPQSSNDEQGRVINFRKKICKKKYYLFSRKKTNK